MEARSRSAVSSSAVARIRGVASAWLERRLGSPTRRVLDVRTDTPLAAAPVVRHPPASFTARVPA